ncbi:ethylene-responsive transcription factor ERF014-like [Magnolia sinica]|uniref:ethylene-responsive transcription factor ERF014-like n=1 Tax=Magnolia sinica TaxID=86752 RepID=UPI0026588FEC|nr:ethylene-responsive transcription factor ERF014-like [Magnolia sinica]
MLIKTRSINTIRSPLPTSHTPTRKKLQRERKQEAITTIHPPVHLSMVKNSNKRLPTPNGPMEGSADTVQSSSLPKPMSCRKKQFKGVRMRSWGSWVSEIRAPNQKTRIWLGSYSTPEAAARAYDAALLCLKGSSANLNFPITPSTYFPTTLMSPKSIQRVAAAAANATTTTTTTTPSSPIPTLPPPSSSSWPSTSWDTHDEIATSCSSDYTPCAIEQHPSPVNPWIDLDMLLQSPKYTDQMLNACALFGPAATTEVFDDEADFRLWSFC